MSLKHEDLRSQLQFTGEYRTPSDFEPAFFDRLFGRFDGWYYFRMFRVFGLAHLLARLGRFDVQMWEKSAYQMFELMEGCGGKMDISGVLNLKKAKPPYVFVANHMSMLETLIVPLIIFSHCEVTTVVKESLLEYPFFGRVMRAIDPIHVKRENPREDLREVLEKGTRYLQAGRSVLLFPQSTRTPVFDPAQFNSLGFKLAVRAGVPLVPVAVKTDFMGVGKRFRDFGSIDRSKRIYFKVGEPLDVTGKNREAHGATVRFIQENFDIWTRLDKEKEEIT